jgi:hypothetical protein
MLPSLARARGLSKRVIRQSSKGDTAMLQCVDGLVVLELEERPIALLALWGSCNSKGLATKQP